MKTERTVCCGQIGQVMSRILNLTLPPTTDWATFTRSCRGPHLWQTTVEPTTVFGTAFDRTAPSAFKGGSASAITHAATVKARLATRLKVAKLAAGGLLGAGLRERPAEGGDEGVARIGRARDEVGRGAFQLEHLLAQER